MMNEFGKKAARAAKWIGIALGGLLVVLVIVIALLPPLTRPLTDRWGATEAEAEATYPGDELVARPDQSSVRAVSIDAPPELVFALLKQMGYGRGGWYAWDLFYESTGSGDFVDGHSSRRIDPELQQFGTGDYLELFPGARLDVVVYDAPSSLVLYKMTDKANRLIAVGTKPLPAEYSDLSWGWFVEPEGEGSRLILRTQASDAGLGGFAEWINESPLEMGGAVFGYKTLLGIKRTAEQLHEAGVRVDANGVQTAGPENGIDQD